MVCPLAPLRTLHYGGGSQNYSVMANQHIRSVITIVSSGLTRLVSRWRVGVNEKITNDNFGHAQSLAPLSWGVPGRHTAEGVLTSAVVDQAALFIVWAEEYVGENRPSFLVDQAGNDRLPHFQCWPALEQCIHVIICGFINEGCYT